MRTFSARPRRELPGAVITLARPLFRYSRGRDAYVLRGIGNHMGPVLRERRPASAHAAPGDVRRDARFSRR